MSGKVLYFVTDHQVNALRELADGLDVSARQINALANRGLAAALVPDGAIEARWALTRLGFGLLEHLSGIEPAAVVDHV